MSLIAINDAAVDTVIFDFDGTLAKLNIDFDDMRRSVRKLMSGYPIDQQGLSQLFVLEMIAEAGSFLHNISPGLAESFITEAYGIIEKIEVEAARLGELFSGTKHLLSSLREHNIRVGIITRNCNHAVQTVFPDIFSYCPVVLCRDDVQHVKPHPEQLNQALERLSSHPETSVMIGDHPLDITTGHNAGTLTAGVLTGRFQAVDFIAAGATIVLHQASDLIKMMR